MKLLHIASFEGNIGDIINHEGFYSKVIHDDVIKIEIRKFYNNCNELHFDKDLLQYINTFDGLILGGGGFFDVRWEDSHTGTTFDIDDEFINWITVPVLVNAMGLHIDYDNHVAIDKFREFYNKLSNNPRWMITLRNDGSLSRLRLINGIDCTNTLVVPDNGFGFERAPYNGANSNTVGLSITNDLFRTRFNGSITTASFNNQIAEFCKLIIQNHCEIIFFLHAPQDIRVLYELYIKLGNESFRKHIRVAPFDVSSKSNALYYNNLYSQCKYVIAMRFHGNIIAIKNNVPVIGLAGHEQISGLFSELGMEEQCILVKDGFIEKLYILSEKMRANPSFFQNREKQVFNKLAFKQREYAKRVNEFFTNNQNLK